MRVLYRTHVAHLPPTPLSLLPARWVIEHICTICHAIVTGDELIDHARHHDTTPASTGTNRPCGP